MATKRKFEIGDVVMLKSTGEVFKIKRYVSQHYVVDDGRCYTAVQLEKAGDENFKYGDRVRVIEGYFERSKLSFVYFCNDRAVYRKRTGSGKCGTSDSC